MNYIKSLLLSALCLATMPLSAQRYLGGDISLLPTYEEMGTVYRDSAGKAKPFFQLVSHDGGWNAARVRLFVNPEYAPAQAKDEGVLQDLDYILPLCKSIKQAGMALMLDFHYSDTWADPGKQFMPKAWAKAPQDALADSVYAYTRHSLLTLLRHGVKPDMIQVGNEITFGMMWPNGRVDPTKDDNWPTLASYLKAGVKACREVCPEAKLIIHTEHAQDWAATFGYYDLLRRQGVDYDVIGLSYYPMWHGSISHLGLVLDSLEANFPRKDIMIVEAAAYYSHENDRWAKAGEYSEFFPISKEGQREFTLELVAMLNRHPRVKGLFWWYPEENESGRRVVSSWLNRGLFDNHTGRALPAFYAMSRLKTLCQAEPVGLCKRHHRVDSPQRGYSPSTLIIWYNKTARNKRRLLKAIEDYGAKLIYDYKSFSSMAISIPKGKDIHEAKRHFERVKGVTQVSYDRIMKLMKERKGVRR